MSIDLNLLDDQALDALISEAETLKVSRRKAHLKSVRNEIIRLAQESGLDLQELMDGADKIKPSKVVKKVAAKYRATTDASLTWTGRGRKPAWVESHLAAGGTMEDLVIA